MAEIHFFKKKLHSGQKWPKGSPKNGGKLPKAIPYPLCPTNGR